MDMGKVLRDLQEAMVVTAYMERVQTEHIGELQEFRRRTELNLGKISENLAEVTGKLNNRVIGAHIEESAEQQEYRRRIEAEIQEYRRRTKRNLAEITGKLNRLIGYGDSSRPSPQ